MTLLRFGAIATRNFPTYLVIHVAASTVAETSSARPARGSREPVPGGDGAEAAPADLPMIGGARRASGS